MKGWQQFDPTWTGSVAALPGCYVIFVGREIVYIGQSESVKRRIKGYAFSNVAGHDDMRNGHTITPWGNFRWADGKVTGRVRYARKYGEQLMTEARLIRRLKPQMNRRGLGNGR